MEAANADVERRMRGAAESVDIEEIGEDEDSYIEMVRLLRARDTHPTYIITEHWPRCL